ncbi:MAG: hypothetical protein K6G61_01275, partial [Solobacterium sp.]|nr:hypothetical protein [Solobacterium sp.]
DDRNVICTASQEGFRKGLEWLHKLYAQNLIDVEAFTQDWSTYVAKGKSGRYGVCFTWDISNVVQVSTEDLIAGNNWIPLPALAADVTNITPNNGSFTSGFERGRCVVTAAAQDPALVCAWLDRMYAPLQSVQNNWGTYGEADDFDIFNMGENENGEPMLRHAFLADASPTEIMEAEAVGGPLAVLDSYYDVYVTCPDDVQYRMEWIRDIYAPDMNTRYVIPNAFMTPEDTKRCQDLQADIGRCINIAKSEWVMNGFSDADWNRLQAELSAYGIDELTGIYQKYVDAYYR